MNMVFPFASALADFATWFVQADPPTFVRTKYLDLVLKLTRDWEDESISSD